MPDEAKQRDGDVDPLEFLRKMLQISPEDAASVRKDAAAMQNRADRGQSAQPDDNRAHDVGDADGGGQ